MQGGGRHNLAKSHQISIAWNGVSLLKRAGKSRENHLCQAAWRSRLVSVLAPRTGDCPLEPRIGFEPPASPFLGTELLVLEGLDIAITGTEKLSVCDAGNVGS